MPAPSRAAWNGSSAGSPRAARISPCASRAAISSRRSTRRLRGYCLSCAGSSLPPHPDPLPLSGERGYTSVELVEAFGAAGQDLTLGLRGELGTVRDQLGRAGEEAVGMRIVGGPEDLVGPDVVRQDGEAALHGFEGDPTVSPEELARAQGEPRVVETLVVEVAIHAIEPAGDPAPARLEEADAHLGMAVAHALPDHAHGGQHHLHGVGDDVLRAARLEAVHAHLRHTAARPLVEADGHVEILHFFPEDLVVRMMQHAAVVGIRTE